MSLVDLEEQGQVLAAAGLDVDLHALDALIGPLTEEVVERGPGRIRIKERTTTATWDGNAACRGMDVNDFYPTRQSTPEEMREIRKVCVDCPVRWRCLAYSLMNWEKIGIWGGFTEIERRELRKAVKQAINEGVLPADDENAVALWLEETMRGATRSVARGAYGRGAIGR